MSTLDEIFAKGFADAMGATGGEQEAEMPVFAKLAANLGLLEEEEPAMPIFEKLAENLGLLEEEGTADEELDLSGMTELEKFAFTKWIEKNGIDPKGLIERAKAGVSSLKGEGVSAARKKLEAAKAEKPKTLRLFSKRKAKAGVAAAETGLAAAKSRRMRTGLGVGAAAGGALLTAAAAKKLISGRKKKEKAGAA